MRCFVLVLCVLHVSVRRVLVMVATFRSGPQALTKSQAGHGTNHRAPTTHKGACRVNPGTTCTQLRSMVMVLVLQLVVDLQMLLVRSSKPDLFCAAMSCCPIMGMVGVTLHCCCVPH